MSLAIFVGSRLLANTSLAQRFLRQGAGIAAVVAPPVCWFLLIFQNRPLPFEHSAIKWALTETGASLICVLLFLTGTWQSRVPCFIAVICNSIFWSGLFFWTFPLGSSLLSLAALASGLSWLVYVGRNKHSAAESLA